MLKNKNDVVDVKIVDFGLSSFVNKKFIFSRCGTPGYVAPEVILYKDNDKQYNQKCDIFSAGVIFYVMLTGCSPFPSSNLEEVLRMNK